MQAHYAIGDVKELSLFDVKKPDVKTEAGYAVSPVDKLHSVHVRVNDPRGQGILLGLDRSAHRNFPVLSRTVLLPEFLGMPPSVRVIRIRKSILRQFQPYSRKLKHVNYTDPAQKPKMNLEKYENAANLSHIFVKWKIVR